MSQAFRRVITLFRTQAVHTLSKVSVVPINVRCAVNNMRQEELCIRAVRPVIHPFVVHLTVH